jgi:hypothetical protein
MFDYVFNSEKCIHIVPTKRNDEEAKQLADKIGINIYDAKNQLKWHEVNGKNYYFKFNDRLVRILNELIGPKIAVKLDLRTVNNIPAIMEYGNNLKLYGILSENFKDKNKQYLSMHELGLKNRQGIDSKWKNIPKLKKYCNQEDYDDLINSIFKMTCLDYIMGQADRVSSNFLFEQENLKVTFAPLFDYSEAYESIKDGCVYDKYHNPSLPFSVGNAFMTLTFWETKFKWFLWKYPNFAKYLEIACDIDIIKILEEIEEQYYLQIPDDYKSYYTVRTKEKQKALFF